MQILERSCLIVQNVIVLTLAKLVERGREGGREFLFSQGWKKEAALFFFFLHGRTFGFTNCIRGK